MKKQILYLIFLLIPIVVLLSCGGNSFKPEDIVFPEDNITYHQHVEPLLRYTCNYPGCHTVYDRAGGVVLDSYEQLLFASSGQMVIAGDPDRSHLILYLTYQLHHSMPIDFRITKSQLDGLKKWILNGAPR